jgi:hypothetical protein
MGSYYDKRQVSTLLKKQRSIMSWLVRKSMLNPCIGAWKFWYSAQQTRKRIHKARIPILIVGLGRCQDERNGIDTVSREACSGRYEENLTKNVNFW